ncbi:MAG TPA: hypothetical protein VHV83_19825, partial [Armatimonadota bacterium]|nr:hypothetical protein [Armatimonadota bacterium]
AQDGKPLTPSQAAAATGVNVATCVRIMAELVDAGYLAKISRRSGYIGGPQIFSLAGRQGVHQALVENSRDALRELAEKVGATVNLAIFAPDHRRILLSSPPPGGRQVALQNLYETADDFYLSATGRLLLSRATPTIRESVIAAVGLPGDSWDGIDSISALHDALDKLRQSKEITFYHQGFNLWIIGAIIDVPNYPAFSFGFGVRAENKHMAIDACHQAALRIEAKFHHREMLGF